MPEPLEPDALESDPLESDPLMRGSARPGPLGPGCSCWSRSTGPLEPELLVPEPLEPELLVPEPLSRSCSCRSCSCRSRSTRSRWSRNRSTRIRWSGSAGAGSAGAGVARAGVARARLCPEPLDPEPLEPELLVPELLVPEPLDPEPLEPESLDPEPLEPESLVPELLGPDPEPLCPDPLGPERSSPSRSTPSPPDPGPELSSTLESATAGAGVTVRTVDGVCPLGGKVAAARGRSSVCRPTSSRTVACTGRPTATAAVHRGDLGGHGGGPDARKGRGSARACARACARDHGVEPRNEPGQLLAQGCGHDERPLSGARDLAELLDEPATRAREASRPLLLKRSSPPRSVRTTGRRTRAGRVPRVGGAAAQRSRSRHRRGRLGPRRCPPDPAPCRAGPPREAATDAASARFVGTRSARWSPATLPDRGAECRPAGCDAR